MEPSPSVKKLLDDIQYQSQQKFEIVQSLRDLIKSINPHFIEGVKYGGIVFSCNGDLKCGVFVYKNHLSIEFSAGAEFPDPGNLLEGNGKFRRHLKLKQLADIETKKVAHFVELAIC